MGKKVKVAVIDKDLKIRKIGNVDLNKDGTKLKIKKGGKKHWYPEFDTSSYLEFPSLFGWKRIYFVVNNAKKCIDFKTKPPEISGPDPQVVMDAAEAAILNNLGREKQETPWQLWVILGINALLLLYSMGVIV